MQAVIQDRGRQYIVNDGDELVVDFMADAEPGSEIIFDRVLSLEDTFGTPLVEGAKVAAKIVAHERGKKIYVCKFRRRKDYRRRQGHRQNHTRIAITSIAG